MALLKRSRTQPDDGRMTLMEHIRELRSRLIKSIAAMVVATAVGFVFFDPVWSFITGPYCRLPQAYKITDGNACSLVVHGILDGFIVNLKVAAIFGLVVSSPVWLYQIWAFVAPALLPRIKQIDKERFVMVVDRGFTGQVGVMPAWGMNPNVNRYYDELWAYLRARSDGVLPPGRPERLPEQ